MSKLIATGVLFFLLLLSCLGVTVPNISNQCIVFNTTTCNALQGVIDGGRCFFIVKDMSSWTEAWTICQQYGAVLAQIHTESEYNAIQQLPYLSLPGAPATWIAAQHDPDPNVPSPFPCSTIQENITYWYDDANTRNLNMKAAYTWIRFRKCDDHDLGNETCMTVWNRTLFYDVTCDWAQVVSLCQLTNLIQNFTQTNVCITETPIEQHITYDPESCAQICVQRIWCRSFNFMQGAVTCQLFTWSIYDTCPNCANKISAIGIDCFHYNYVP